PWKQRLEEAVSRAVAQNPSVAEMESRVDAARHRVGQASALPDPEIEITAQDVPPSDFSFSRDYFTMTKVTARQVFPGAGNRPTREKVADAALAACEALHVEHLSRIAADVADAFFAVADVDAQSEILEASRQRFERVAASASERYRLGKGLQTDVLGASLEGTALEEKKIGLAGEGRVVRARLETPRALPPAN